MLKPSENMLLRIRIESLEANLRQAYECLSDLPNLSTRLSVIKQQVDDIKDKATNHTRLTFDVRKDRKEKKELRAVEDFFETLTDQLDGIRKALGELEENSFLVEIQSAGADRWREVLSNRAAAMLLAIKKLQPRNELTDPTIWQSLKQVNDQAKLEVFHESVELLGGIALRDTQLDAALCRLGDSLIKAVRPTAKSAHYAILGGMATFDMRLERLIRLPFPQWSVWALPLAAHEIWQRDDELQTSVRSKLNLEMAQAGIDGAGLEPFATYLADAYATYTLGPAYAFAAAGLWYDPANALYDKRVCVVANMLAGMDPGEGKLVAAYSSVVDDFWQAWASAREQAGAAPDPARIGSGPGEVEIARRLCKAFLDAGAQAFTLESWEALKADGRDWVTMLQRGDLEAIKTVEVRGRDQRHVLNAGWRARLATPAANIAQLTKTVTELGKRVVEAEKLGKIAARPLGGVS